MRMKREFYSMRQLHTLNPIIVPKPHAVGEITTQWNHNTMESRERRRKEREFEMREMAVPL